MLLFLTSVLNIRIIIQLPYGKNLVKIGPIDFAIIWHQILTIWYRYVVVDQGSNLFLRSLKGRCHGNQF